MSTNEIHNIRHNVKVDGHMWPNYLVNEQEYNPGLIGPENAALANNKPTKAYIYIYLYI